AAVRGQLAREQHRAHGRLLEIRRVRMPDAAEIVALVLELLHLDHLGKPVDSPDERVLDRLAHAAGEGHELRRRQPLVAEKDDLVSEKGLSNFIFWKIL